MTSNVFRLLLGWMEAKILSGRLISHLSGWKAGTGEPLHKPGGLRSASRGCLDRYESFLEVYEWRGVVTREASVAERSEFLYRR